MNIFCMLFLEYNPQLPLVGKLWVSIVIILKTIDHGLHLVDLKQNKMSMTMYT